MSTEETVITTDIQTPHGKLSLKMGVPKKPLGPADLVPGALHLSDRIAQLSVQKSAADGKPVSCRKGCAACCRPLVPVSKPEAFYLADIVDSMPPEVREVVEERFENAANALRREGILRTVLDPESTDEDHREAARVYFHLGIPCPFLKSGEVCGIHPARPAACREHNVTSPAELCQDPFGNQVRPLPMAIRMNSVLARLWAQEKDETAQFLPMPIALEWAREHRAERAPVAEGPALFGRFLGVLGRAGRAQPEGEPDEAET